MKVLKKWAVHIVASSMAFSLTACGFGGATSSTSIVEKDKTAEVESIKDEKVPAGKESIDDKKGALNKQDTKITTTEGQTAKNKQNQKNNKKEKPEKVEVPKGLNVAKDVKPQENVTPQENVSPIEETKKNDEPTLSSSTNTYSGNPAIKPATESSYQGFKANSEYKLVWADEFNGNSINESNWTYEVHAPGWVNAEWQSYEASTDNAYVQDGKLIIQPIKTVNEDGTESYTSGRINTNNKQTFQYGYFEARIKMPTGKGFLPAFWMMPEDENLYGQWPKCGEIDIAEVKGHETNKLYGTIHYGAPHAESQGTKVLTKGDFANEYHVYGIDWQPGSIKWYCDGVLYHEENDWYSKNPGVGTVSYPAPFDQPFYIIFNVAVGGSWVGNPDATTDFSDPSKTQMAVDYVRVYQKDSYNEDVEKPVKEVVLRNPDANGNYINNGNFDTVESLTDDVDWKFMTDLGGVANAAIANNTMTITTQDAGTVDYSVQLVQAGVPLKKGATYKVSFDATASENRKMNVAVKAPDRSYMAYISKDVTLTTESQTFEYNFKMTEDDDANGRLEYNMGASGSTATIDIKNVRIEMIQDADPNAVEEKTVLSNGNLVSNGAFQEGTGSLGFWTISGADTAGAVKVRKNDASGNIVRELVATLNNTAEAPLVLAQKDLAFEDGVNYQLSFKARLSRASDQSATALFQKAANTEDENTPVLKVVYRGHEETVALTEENKIYTFDIPADINADKDIKFVMSGKGTIVLDDVMIVENALIKNGNFNAGTSGFEIYVDGSATASAVVDTLERNDAMMDFTINNTADAEWKIQLKQSNVKLEEGEWYKLKFDIRSSMNRSIQYSIQRDGSVHKTENGAEDWTPYAQDTINLNASNSTFTTVEKIFQMSQKTDAGSIFNIALGGNAITEQHRICIDNVILEKTDERPVIEDHADNLLTNGDFAEGNKGWSLEAHAPAVASWNVTDQKAIATITDLSQTNASGEAWKVNIKQTGLRLVKNAEYEVTATITSDVDRTAEFSCMDIASKKWYVVDNNMISLEAGVPKTFTFKVKNEQETDNDAYIGFNIGRINENTPNASVVTFENIIMKQLTPGDEEVTPSSQDFGLLRDLKQTICEDATGKTKAENDVFVYNITKTGSQEYGVQLSNGGLNLKKDAKYKAAFKITSQKAVKVKLGIRDLNNEYKGCYEDIDLSAGTEKAYEKEIVWGNCSETGDKTTNNGEFCILMGTFNGNEITDNTITISDVSFVMTEDAQEQIQEAEKITGETEETSDPKTTTESGETDTFEKQVGNLLKDFKLDGNAASTSCTATEQDGTITYTMANNGSNEWDVQLEKTGLTFVKGRKYVVKVTLSSTVERNVKVCFRDVNQGYYGGYGTPQIGESNSEVRIELTWDKETTTNGEFKLFMGAVEVIENDQKSVQFVTNEHTITISNLSLEEVNE